MYNTAHITSNTHYISISEVVDESSYNSGDLARPSDSNSFLKYFSSKVINALTSMYFYIRYNIIGYGQIYTKYYAYSKIPSLTEFGISEFDYASPDSSYTYQVYGLDLNHIMEFGSPTLKYFLPAGNTNAKVKFTDDSGTQPCYILANCPAITYRNTTGSSMIICDVCISPNGIPELRHTGKIGALSFIRMLTKPQ